MKAEKLKGGIRHPDEAICRIRIDSGMREAGDRREGVGMRRVFFKILFDKKRI